MPGLECSWIKRIRCCVWGVSVICKGWKHRAIALIRLTDEPACSHMCWPGTHLLHLVCVCECVGTMAPLFAHLPLLQSLPYTCALQSSECPSPRPQHPLCLSHTLQSTLVLTLHPALAFSAALQRTMHIQQAYNGACGPWSWCFISNLKRNDIKGSFISQLHPPKHPSPHPAHPIITCTHIFFWVWGVRHESRGNVRTAVETRVGGRVVGF